MDQGKERLQYLWEQYLNKSASPKELDELFARLNQPDNENFSRSVLEQYFASELKTISEQQPFDKSYWLSKLDAIKAKAETETPVREIAPTTPVRRLWPRYAAAAAVLIGLGTYFYFGTGKQPAAATTTIAKTKTDVLPGSAKATLTLADNKQIILDSAANGELAQQGNTKIIKLATGEITYNESNEKPKEELMNTLTVPRGGTYELTLPDGTRVWLNAASSITYPTAFSKDRRHVDVTGEVYFEVKHDAARPFSVSTRGMEVEDIGTHFNINAYTDEDAIRTTLLEGSVRVREQQLSKVLLPGEQAKVSAGNTASSIQVRAVDAGASVAWKDGFFHFEKSDIRDVMRQLSRWYDIDVEFEKPVTDHLFGGKISRNLNLTEVLDVLKTNNIEFRIEGRKIIVQ